MSSHNLGLGLRNETKEIVKITNQRQIEGVKNEAVYITTYESITEIDAEKWGSFVTSPFVSHTFLKILEESKCLGGDTGWIPVYVVATNEEKEIIGALPFYIKTHSAGEFVFDWGWADAAHHAGIAYYPKGLIAAPFSPVPGERLLTEPGDYRTKAALIQGAHEVMVQMGLSSLHFNFLRDEDLQALKEAKLPIRYGVQYHWYNSNINNEVYQNYDAFLSRFRSKRRANLRRERKKLREQGVTTKVLQGAEITEEHVSQMYDFYLSTINKFSWGRQYLNEDFFQLALEALTDSLHFVFAERDKQIFAGAFNLKDDERLYGRYWGCNQEIDYAHFEICMYTPIEWCIENGIKVFEPGAGGDHKFERGFIPTKTYSAHFLRNPGLNRAVVDSLNYEAQQLDKKFAYFRTQSPFKEPGF